MAADKKTAMPLAKLYEIFRAQPRYAEPADRQRPLQKETDRDNKKNKHKESRDEKDLLFGEDQMEISIQSLKTFFTGLLDQQNTAPVSSEDGQQDKDSTKKRGSPGTKAVKAYRHAAETASEPALPEQTQKEASPEDQEQSGATILDKAEQEKIHGLLVLLDRLETQNIKNITLKPAPRFLDSVENAIKKELEG